MVWWWTSDGNSQASPLGIQQKQNATFTNDVQHSPQMPDVYGSPTLWLRKIVDAIIDDFDHRFINVEIGV
jgi:hypothetical protein